MSAVALRPIGPTPLEESLARLERLVSPLTGVVRRLWEPLPSPTEPALVRTAADVTAGGELLGASLQHLREGTGGAGVNRKAARAAAIGEAAERYSAAFVPSASIVRATARELGGGAVPPESFALFSEAQYRRKSFPFQKFTRDTPVSWTQGFSLPGGEPALLPSQLVYLRDGRVGSSEIPIGYATSNGLACAPTLEEALLGGLLEVLERDAFLLTWHGRLSLARLDWSSHRELLDLEERYCTPTGLRYELVDLGTFHNVPTVAAVVRGRPPCGAFAVGAACHPTIEVAWRKALSEAFSVEAWARALVRADPTRTFRPDFDDIRVFADHVHFYADAARAARAGFLDGSPKTRPVAEIEPLVGGDVRTQIEGLTSRIERSGQVAYAIDVTSPDVHEAGLRVAKVIVPGFCQLDADYRYRFLGADRLLTAAWRCGLRDAPLTVEELNKDPHPFP